MRRCTASLAQPQDTLGCCGGSETVTPFCACAAQLCVRLRTLDTIEGHYKSLCANPQHNIIDNSGNVCASQNCTSREKRTLGLFQAMHFDEVAVSITDHLSCHPTNIGQSRKHQLQYFIPHCNTKLNQNSFSVSTAKMWNALPIGSPLLEGPRSIHVSPTSCCRPGTEMDRR